MTNAQPEKKILVVEDDASMSTALEQMLKAMGYSVMVAADGLAAQSVLALQDFDLVLSDIRMPNMNGIELLHHIKRTKPIPVVLMTGFSEIAETKEAYDLGAKGFLAKPFKKAELTEAFDQILGKTAEVPQEEDLDPQFTGLRIEEFVTGKEILYDIYVRLANTKYVKVGSGGESLSMERIAKYREKGLNHLYLRKEDFRRYLGFTKTVAKKVAGAMNIDHNRKVAFLAQTSRAAMKHLYRESIDKDTFEVATELVAMAGEVLCEQPEAYALFDVLRSQGDAMYAHSLAVSLYSTLIARHVGWKSPRTLTRLAMAGLMHDIGKKEIDPAILEKTRVELSAEEVRLLESHPTRGAEILRDLSEVPEEVVQVALQHHENCKGLGYPMRLSKGHIIPLARLVAVAEEFCELAFPPSAKHKALSANEALQRVNETDLGRHDPEFLKALNEIFISGLKKDGPKPAS